MKRALILLCFIMVLASGGCRDAAPVEQKPSDSATQTPAPSPTPSVQFVSSQDAPVFTHGDEGSWYPAIVEPGSVVRKDGLHYMFFNGLSGWPAKAAVGLAVSEDGLAWEPVSDQPLLDSAAEEFTGFTFFVSSVLMLDDGNWAMYLYTLDEGRDGAPGNILMATAPALEGSWKLDPEPVLLPGEPGAWDGSRVTQPVVVQGNGAYYMYFSGYENDRLRGGRSIGLATSTDGIHWSKRPEPIFSFSEDTHDWDAFRVFQPRVVPVPEGYLLFYKSNVSIGWEESWGFATSPDGIEWDRYAGNPVIDFQAFPIEWRRTGLAELTIENGELALYLEILEREGGGHHHGNADYQSNIYRFTGTGFP